MTIEGNLTTKDVMDRFKEMDDRYGKLVGDVNLALGKISETTTELQKSKEIYERPLHVYLKKVIEKHPKFSICACVLIVGLFISGTLYFLKDKKVELNTQNVKLSSPKTN